MSSGGAERAGRGVMNIRDLQREAHAKCACRGCPNDADYGEGAYVGYCGPCLDESPDLQGFADEYISHVRNGIPWRKCRHGLS